MVLLLVALLGLAVGEDSRKPFEVRQHVVWRDARGDYFAEGLSISRGGENFVQRWWVVTPERHRVMLTSRMDLETCAVVDEVRDRETGWWAEVRNEVKLGRRCTIKGMERLPFTLAEENPMVAFSLRTREGFSASIAGRAMDEGPDPVAVIVASLIEEKEPERFGEPVQEELRFLAAVSGRKGIGLHASTVKDLIEMLAKAMPPGVPDYGGIGWEEGKGRMHLGPGAAASSTYRDLLEGFGVDPERPFADLDRSSAASE